MSSTTTTLASELDEVKKNFYAHGPKEAVATIQTTNTNFTSTFDYSKVIKVGSKLPSFTLPDANGNEARSADLLSQGPLLLTFYRGEWCPYCNLALRALQKALPQIQAKGVTLVAVSPELPDQALSTSEKIGLHFPVLSDVGNRFAETLGILFAQPEAMRPVFKNFGVDFEKRNGDDSLVVPLPASFLIDGTGTVRNAYVEADYSQRMEPRIALEWIEEL